MKKEIVSISGACSDQARVRIRFDLSGKLKELIQNLLSEGFALEVDQEGFLAGKLEGSFEEVSRVLELLKINGFKP